MIDDLKWIYEKRRRDVDDVRKREPDRAYVAPFRSDAPCYYCDLAPTGCHYCIINPDAEIWERLGVK